MPDSPSQLASCSSASRRPSPSKAPATGTLIALGGWLIAADPPPTWPPPAGSWRRASGRLELGGDGRRPGDALGHRRTVDRLLPDLAQRLLVGIGLHVELRLHLAV